MQLIHIFRFSAQNFGINTKLYFYVIPYKMTFKLVSNLS
jgi:hypothetical protein